MRRKLCIALVASLRVPLQHAACHCASRDCADLDNLQNQGLLALQVPTRQAVPDYEIWRGCVLVLAARDAGVEKCA
jgi:hypothetical protein